jgi:hypothetical protein
MCKKEGSMSTVSKKSKKVISDVVSHPIAHASEDSGHSLSVDISPKKPSKSLKGVKSPKVKSEVNSESAPKKSKVRAAKSKKSTQSPSKTKTTIQTQTKPATSSQVVISSFDWDAKVAPEHAFYLADGKVLHNLVDLVTEFDKMSEQVFRHHVSFHHNDFANWIEHVHKIAELANNVREAHTKDEMQLLVLKHIVKNI